jgi:hypothetical protein
LVNQLAVAGAWPDPVASVDLARRRSRMRALAACLVFMLLACAGAAVAVLSSRPDGGTLRVHVQSHNGGELPLADVYLDGEKVCEASPCVLRDVPPGARTLRVSAPGHLPHEQSVSVDKGQDRLLAVTVKRR